MTGLVHIADHDVHISDGTGIKPLAVPTAIAAHLIGVRHQTLSNWRCAGKGPRYIALSPNRVVYKLADLDEWLESQRVGGGAK